MKLSSKLCKLLQDQTTALSLPATMEVILWIWSTLWPNCSPRSISETSRNGDWRLWILSQPRLNILGHQSRRSRRGQDSRERNSSSVMSDNSNMHLHLLKTWELCPRIPGPKSPHSHRISRNSSLGPHLSISQVICTNQNLLLRPSQFEHPSLPFRRRSSKKVTQANHCTFFSNSSMLLFRHATNIHLSRKISCRRMQSCA